MRYLNHKLALLILASAGILVLASCKTETAEPEKSAGSSAGGRAVTVTPGVAGGSIEDSYIATATVSAVDAPTRQITLTGESGNKVTFKAGPEIRNFDQIHLGDKVKATLNERIDVFVRTDSVEPSVSHAGAVARAPVGAKPGVMAAEMYEVIASVKAIDTVKRTATLGFSDGSIRVITVRSDVDLTRYKVGDSVVIRVTTALSVIVRTP